MQSLIARVHWWLALASVCCLASAGASAASLHVTATDSMSNKAYDLNFGSPPPPPANQLNIQALPAWPGGSVRSIVYVPNEQTAKADLLAADNRTSRIVRYAGAAGPALAVWDGTGKGSKPGPLTPLGMSVDNFGNVFVVRGDQGRPELWVLKNNGGGAFSAPILIDNTSFVPAGSTPRLMDTLVVQTSVAGGLSVGDLLVLVSDGRVFRYSAASIANAVAGHGLIGTPTVIVPVSYFSQGHIPTSMAIWPADGSLLVTTVDGAVRRFSVTPTGSTPFQYYFATGLGSEATGNGQLLGLIRTYVDSGTPFAVLDNPQKNKIFKLGAPTTNCSNVAVACNLPKATITTVANPVGLAVTDASTENSNCDTGANPNGCALLSGTVKVGVNKVNPGGSVIALSCTVDDPRFNTGLGKCDDTNTGSFTLLASSVCPGYPATKVPAYLCGTSGASGHAMTFLKFEEAGGFGVAPSDLLVNVELSAEAILGTANGILCPQLTMGWAPLSGEGTIPEGSFMTEPTSSCGSARGLPPGHSLMLIGAQINAGTDLVALANDKFDALSSTISGATNMNATDRTNLGIFVAHGKTLLGASHLTTANQYACAAHQAYTSDQTVTSGQFSTNTTSLSALSAIKGRLENLVMHIDNRLRAIATVPWPQTDPLPGAGTVATCDITAPSAPAAPGATEVSSDATDTIYAVSWTASTDTGETSSNNPGPYASGIQRYHVYLDTVEVTGSPTTALTLQITINDGTPASHSVTIKADDNATGGSSPAYNTSSAAATTAQCTDLINNTDLTSNPDGVCDVVASPP